MEDRETSRMRKYGESKTTRIMMATVRHVTSSSGLRKFQADGFLLDWVYVKKPLGFKSLHFDIMEDRKLKIARAGFTYKGLFFSYRVSIKSAEWFRNDVGVFPSNVAKVNYGTVWDLKFSGRGNRSLLLPAGVTSYVQGVPGGMCQTSGECSLG